MRNLVIFLRDNYRKASFGPILTFLSSFGQTFLISVYVPEIILTFDMTEGSFGSLYALATVISSVIMLTVGHYIDHKPVKQVTALTLIGLIISLVLLGFSHYSIILLMAALIGMRLNGQGLLTHISYTIMARYYSKDRGKALSVASWGFALGEALIPLTISFFMIEFGYEAASFISAGLLLLYLISLAFTDVSHFNAPATAEAKPSGFTLAKGFHKIIKGRAFSIIAPASFALSFTSTAVFFYQYVFVNLKGWSPALYATFFTGYAVSRFVFSIVGGLWIDRFSGRKVFRLYITPLALGLIPFALMDSIAGALIFLLLAGCTIGMAGTVKSAVLAEVYGIEKLGTIRSLFTMFMVLSTALGPLVVGSLMDWGVTFQQIMLGLSAMIFLAALNAQRMGKQGEEKVD